MAGAIIDPRSPWVQVQPAPVVFPHWTLTACVYQDETESGGNHNIYISLLDENGAPLSGIKVWQKWPTAEPKEAQQATLGGVTNFGIYGGPFYPDRGERGVYSCYVESPTVSDVVTGMGLPANRHVNYLLTFRRVVQLTPLPPPPAPPPGGEEAAIRARLARALRLAADDIERA